MTMQEALHALEEVKQAINLAYSSGYSAGKQQRPWVGLTDEELKHEWEVWRANLPRYVGFAKAIEAKLKEKNND